MNQLKQIPEKGLYFKNDHFVNIYIMHNTLDINFKDLNINRIF